MADLWNLEWFYFGDCKCLISGEKSFLIDDLIQLVDEGEDPNTVIKADDTAPLPPLIQMVKDCTVGRRKEPDYEWTKDWPFQQLSLRQAVPRDEIIITPTRVILPFPFRTNNPDFQRKVVDQVIDNIPVFDEVAIQPSLNVSSLLSVVDDLIKDEDAPELEQLRNANTSAEKREAILAYGARHPKGPIYIPPDLEISATSIRSNQTYLKAESPTKLHFHIGLTYDEDWIKFEPWPCGAFDDGCMESLSASQDSSTLALFSVPSA